MKKAEIIFATLSFIGVTLNFLILPGGATMTALALMALSILYAFFGFALFNNIRLRTIFKKESYNNASSLRILGAVGTGWALSATVNGLLFKFQSWHMPESRLVAGLLGLLIVTIFGIIKYSKNKSEYYITIFKRVAILGVLGLVFTLTPKTSWIDLKYRNHPTYLDALKKSLDDPHNQQLWDKAVEEREKMMNDINRK